jgi:hypothetical protein
MNERIKELAEQARKHFPKTETSGEFWVFDEEKFAELIVQECISMADKESERYSNLDQEYCSMAMDNFRELVRKHFGIKDRAVPILSADEQALFAGIASSKLFTIAGAKKHFGVEE